MAVLGLDPGLTISFAFIIPGNKQQKLNEETHVLYKWLYKDLLVLPRSILAVVVQLHPNQGVNEQIVHS